MSIVFPTRWGPRPRLWSIVSVLLPRIIVALACGLGASHDDVSCVKESVRGAVGEKVVPSYLPTYLRTVRLTSYYFLSAE